MKLWRAAVVAAVGVALPGATVDVALAQLFGAFDDVEVAR